MLSNHRSKPAAIAKGRRLARRHGEQYTIHRGDDVVMSTKSYEITPLEV